MKLDDEYECSILFQRIDSIGTSYLLAGKKTNYIDYIYKPQISQLTQSTSFLFLCPHWLLHSLHRSYPHPPSASQKATIHLRATQATKHTTPRPVSWCPQHPIRKPLLPIHHPHPSPNTLLPRAIRLKGPIPPGI